MARPVVWFAPEDDMSCHLQAMADLKAEREQRKANPEVRSDRVAVETPEGDIIWLESKDADAYRKAIAKKENESK